MIRALQPALAGDLRQTVVIENRTGAGGNIGMAAVVQAAADGYTLGVAAAGVLTVNPHLNCAAMSFDPLKDLVPITLLAEIPFVLVASQQSKFSSVDDVIVAARARPGELSIGHGGNGTAMHLTSALFNQKAGVNIQLIAYRGSAPAAVDVLAGLIPLAVLDVPVSQQLIRDGKLKALGVSAAGRVSFLPDVPPLSELGLKDFDSVGWFGLVAPAGTPPEIIARLNAAFVKALSDPAAAARSACSAPSPRRRHRKILQIHSQRKREMEQAHHRRRYQGRVRQRAVSSHQLRARVSHSRSLAGTPNCLRHTSASTATPSRICSRDGLAKHSRSRLPA